jgi:hypothetical protein
VASTKDAHFTVLGFTAANGNPVLCPIIFASKALEEEWVLGLDPFAACEGEEGDIQGYRGKGKRYPQGPVCVVDGKSFPTHCCDSESGSIAAPELLVGMLNHMDNSGLKGTLSLKKVSYNIMTILFLWSVCDHHNTGMYRIWWLCWY